MVASGSQIESQEEKEELLTSWKSEIPVGSIGFSYELSDAGDGNTKISISITQSNVSDSFHMQLPLFIVLNGERRYLGLLKVTGTKPLNAGLTLRVRPEKVLLDPDRCILAEINQ